MITVSQRTYLLALAAREMKGAAQADEAALNGFISEAGPLVKSWGVENPEEYLKMLWNRHFKIIRDTWIHGWECMQHTASLLYQDPVYCPDELKEKELA